MERVTQSLNAIPATVVLWAWPIARILMSLIIYISYSDTSLQSFGMDIMGLLFLPWLGWTFFTALLAVGGQNMSFSILKAVVIGDGLLILFTISTLRGPEGALIAFAICVGIIAVNIGIGWKWIIGAFVLMLFSLSLRIMGIEYLDMVTVAPLAPSNLSEALQILMLVIMALMLVIWANRRNRIEAFHSNFLSSRNLSFEKSFEFDMHMWTSALAMLFSPARAATVVCAPARNSPHQYHQHNLPIWQREQDRDELVTGLRAMPFSCLVFDTEHNRIISPETGSIRPFDENEQRIARVLHRADIKVALVQPMQIDKARGGIICALPCPIDVITILEARDVGQHVAEMATYLGKIAAAQRNFIADAHDVARRDLHDGVLQTLAALRMRLLLLTKRQDVVQLPLELEIRKAVDIVTLEQSRLRGFLEKSETANSTVNLVSQIDICVRTISLQWGIDVKLQSDEPAVPVDTESSLNIEHLLREVITNAVRHAKSKSLTVSLSLKQDALMMAVTDLSHPLEGEQVNEKSALIMKSASLRDRLRLVNGEAYAEGLGKGTLLSIRIPMQQIEDD